MPALPAVPSVIRLDHGFDVGSDSTALVRWHMKYTGGPPSNGDLGTIAVGIVSAYNTDLQDLAHSSVELTSIRLVDLSSDTAAETTQPAAVAGTRAGNRLPAGAAALVNMPIARRYRGGKPRSYWPFGVDSDLQTNQLWTSAFLTALIGGLESYLGAIETLTSGTTVLGQLVSVSYFQGFTAVVNPITGRTKDVPKVRTGTIPVDPIAALVGNTKVASQRRRNQHRS